MSFEPCVQRSCRTSAASRHSPTTTVRSLRGLDPPTRPAALRPLPRRAVLRSIGLSGLVLAAGCSISDPRIEGSGSGGPPHRRTARAARHRRPHRTPTPALPGAQSAARAEADVAALATALLASKAELTSGQRRVRRRRPRRAPAAREPCCSTPDPTARSTAGATAGADPAKPAKVSLAALIAAEKGLAARHAKLVPDLPRAHRAAVRLAQCGRDDVRLGAGGEGQGADPQDAGEPADP